jgi:hypothetical protein
MARRPGLALLIVILGLAMSLIGCGSSATPTPIGPKLPTVPSADSACAGIGLMNTTLAGDASDPRLAWLVQPGGKRLDVVWPPGFTARFVPTLQILDADSNVVFRAGDPIDGGCTGDPYLLIQPGG